MKQIKLMQGDNILSLKKLPENSIDSIVTDPPYGLSAAKNSGKTSTGGFMGKLWDYDVPSIEFWQEAFRVLKPGGHVLSFGGTRTYHRMVVNMEDAGFEIRDQIMWIYGSGFPKSLNIGKAFDKKKGNEREVIGEVKQNNFDKYEKSMMTKEHRDEDTELYKDISITKGSSQYEGWGTALKPANEPICLARKPLSEKNIVDNVIRWGTGGINVDGCRIGDTVDTWPKSRSYAGGQFQPGHIGETQDTGDTPNGRFPANILFDETAAEILDEQSGVSKSTKRITGQDYNKQSDNINIGGGNKNYEYNDKGGASRFFYIAKVSKKERNLGLDNFEEVKFIGDETDMANANQDGPYKTRPTMMKNNHPTLKPINLMTYLCRLITPPGGIVLDPFMGSGSTGISACLEGFRFVGMELQEDYFKIAEARINNFEEYRKLLKK